jgi:hypothetical protein
MSFSRLKYAAESASSAEVAAYKAWKALSKEQKSNEYKTATTAGGPRVKSVRAPGYIIPLRAEATSKIVVRMSVLAKTQTNSIATQLNTLIDDWYHDALPSGITDPEIIQPQGRKYPAIAKITEKSTNAVPRKSRITNVPYSAKTTDSCSAPFGKKVVADTLGAVLNDVENKLAVWAKTSPDLRTYSLRSEAKLF